jgi:hypothetical protein
MLMLIGRWRLILLLPFFFILQVFDSIVPFVCNTIKPLKKLPLAYILPEKRKYKISKKWDKKCPYNILIKNIIPVFIIIK